MLDTSVLLFMYIMTGYDEQTYYLSLTGTHKGPIRGGIFLKFQLVEATPHCLIIYRCEKKQQPETVKHQEMEVVRGRFQGM